MNNTSEDYPGWRNIGLVSEDLGNRQKAFTTEEFICNIGNRSGIIGVHAPLGIIFLQKEIFNLTQTEWMTLYPDLTVELYYSKPNTTKTEIVDTNLISQLNTIKNFKTYSGVTYVTTSDSGIDPIIAIKY